MLQSVNIPAKHGILLSFPSHRIAQNLFKMLHEAKKEQLKRESRFVRHVDKSILDSSASILGKFYKRTTRYRTPIMTFSLLNKDGLFSIYNRVKFQEMDPDVRIELVAVE